MDNWIENIGKLGFGLMRLPKKNGSIDIEQVKTMVDLFLEAGFTYFDTARVYEGSEDAIRQALVERYPRDRYQLATKAASWKGCKTKEEAEAQFGTSLLRTGAGYFDFYLLHNLGESRTRPFEDYDMWSFVQRKKEDGLIRHWGFSFHSTPEELDEILTKHPEAEFVQLQINYADWENPVIQSRRCYETARAHGKPVIVMEPVKGGLLAMPPESVRCIFQNAYPDASPASWGIRFAAELEGVATVLSGMSSIEQMQDNLSYMKNFHSFNAAQRETLERAREELERIALIPCTVCDYCAKVCPVGVGVSGSFTAMNLLTLYGDKDKAVRELEWRVNGHNRKSPEECVGCGKCEKVCPQHISIRKELAGVVDAFF